jgi:hypothetical protein
LASDSFLTQLLRQFAVAFTPLTDALASQAAFTTFLAEFGWQFGGADVVAVGDVFTPISTAIADLERQATSPSANASALGDAVAAIASALAALSTTSIGSLPSPLNTSAFWSTFPDDAFEFLVYTYLQKHVPLLFALLRILGVMREVAVGASAPRQAFLRKTVDWSQIGVSIGKPDQALARTYGWGASLDHAALQTDLAALLSAIHVPTKVVPASRGLLDFYYDRSNLARVGMSQMLGTVFSIGSPGAGGIVKVGFGTVPIPAAANPQGPPIGLGVFPIVAGAGSAEFDISPVVKVKLGGSFQAATVTAEIRPGSVTVQTAPTQLDISGLVSLTASRSPSWLVVGNATSSRLELGKAAIRLGINATASDFEFLIGLDIAAALLTVQFADGDGFLQTILGSQPRTIPIQTAVTWSSKTGLRFDRSPLPQITFSPHITIASVITIDTLKLGMTSGASGAGAFEASISGSLGIGPVAATVKDVGLSISTVPSTLNSPSNLGNLGFDFRFKPPDGIGLSVDATAITGGGYLFFDTDKQEYAGILDLEFADRFSLKVIAVLDTKDGFSLLGLVFVEDFTPIPLGLGFFLEGVGGMLAINRTAAVDKLRAGLKTGSMKSLLFPQAPVKHAHQIIADLDADFPRADNRYIFGPMAEITWGDPTLVTIKIALLIELPEPVRLIIIAQLEALLPDPDKPVVKIHMDALGVVNFGTDDLSLDAVLYDSKLAAFTVTGAMALRMNWGAQPNFALAVGGFSPSYTPPANFPKVERIVIALAAGDNPRIRLDAYLAITSNTFQVGAHLDLHAGAAGFAIDGHLGFDVLIHFSPFSFIADLHASLSLSYNGSVLMGVDLHLTPSGPSPWEANGTATFQVFIFSVSVSFDVTIGTALPAASATPVPDLGAMLVAAFQDLRNWSAIMPADSKTAVAVRPLAPGGQQVFVHPLGALSVHQRFVPLDLSINNYGTIPLSTPVKFTIDPTTITFGSAPGNDGQPIAIKDFFAPAQFQQLTDDQKLARPSFEQYQSGLRFGSSNATAGTPRQSPIGYTTQIVDPNAPAAKAATVAAAATATTGQDYQLPSDSLMRQIPTGAAAKAPGNTTGSAKYAGVVRTVSAGQPAYAIAGTADLMQPAPTDKFVTYSQAIDLLGNKSGVNRQLQIVASHERRYTIATPLTQLAKGTQVISDRVDSLPVSSLDQLTITPTSSLKALYYRIYADPATVPAFTAAAVTGVTFSISGGDGNHYVDWFGVDIQGAEETPQTQHLLLDITPPTLIVSSPAIPGGSKVTVTAKDAGSGVATVSYRWFLQGGTASFQTFAGTTTDITITGEGTFEVDVYATDKVGNVSPQMASSVQTDTTPPTSTLTIGAPGYPADPHFVIPRTILVLSATDSRSGVQSVSYRVYPQSSVPPPPPFITTQAPSVQFTITGSDGPYQVEYQATDKAGNIETVHVQTITLDTTAPKSQLLVGDPKAIQTSTFVAPTTPLTVSAVDAGSGVASVAYCFYAQASTPTSLGAPVPGSNATFALTGPDGAYQVDYQAIDNLGNTEPIHKTDVVYLDSVGPGITVNVPVTQTYAQDFVLDYAADDGSGSGVASLTSTLDGTATAYKQSIKVADLQAGSHTFAVTAMDNVGNTSTKNVTFTT